MDAFSRCLAFTLREEGGFSDNAADPGNWTGRLVGAGELKGTKFGISAASYPSLNIGALSEADAASIYRRDYWAAISGDEFAYPVALTVFDAAVNAGPRRSICWLQLAVGVVADGVLGPATRRAVTASDPIDVAKEALVRRLEFSSRLPTWPQFGLGWTRRIISLAVAITA
jgi:lysozyme family protein